MTPVEVAERLEHFASRVRSIRPADHRNIEAFFEDRSQVASELMAEARELRVPPPAAKASVATISTGIAYARGREIRVVTRGRRGSAR